MTVVWDADEGTYIAAPGVDARKAAIHKLLREIEDEPASSEVAEERRRARLRWSDLEPRDTGETP